MHFLMYFPKSKNFILNKKVRRRIVLSVILLLILATAVLGLLQYGQVQGFKNTLRDLVAEKSEGRLALDLGKTHIDYLNLSFQLENVRLTAAAPESTGIRSIEVPLIKVDIGSLFGYALSRQLQIEELTIEAPYAIVKLSEKGQTRQRVNVAHELAQFAPGIEAFLERFTIDIFRIQRAGTTLIPPETGEIRVSLIDLVVENWDMRQLDDEADIRFALGRQSFRFSRSAFSFDAISYAYRENLLRISDYHFETRDSLNRQVLTLSGEEIAISDPDFKALLEREEFIFGNLHIASPVVEANIYPHTPENEEGLKSRHPVSDLLKEHLGNLLLTTGDIRNASLNLNLFQGGDTIRIGLPGVSVRAEDLIVREDSSTMLLGALSLHIDSSRIDLNDDLELRFSSLNHDENYNISLKEVELISREAGRRIIQAEKLDLYRLNFFTFLYENELRSDSVHISGGTVNLFEPPRETFSDLKNTPDPAKPARGAASVRLGNVLLEDVDVTYELNQRRVYARGVQALAEDITKNDEWQYSLRYIQAPEITFSSGDVDLEVSGLNYRPRNIVLGYALVKKGGLRLEINQLRARPENFLLEQPDAHNWEALDVESISIAGDLSSLAESPQKKKDARGLFFSSIRIGKVDADVHRGDSLAVKLHADELSLNGFEPGGTSLMPASFHGNIRQASLITPGMSASVSQGVLDSRAVSLFSGLTLRTGKGDTLHADKLFLSSVSSRENALYADSLRVLSATYRQPDNHLSTLDSIIIRDLTFATGQAPEVAYAGIYGADINLPEAKGERPDSPSSKGFKPDLPGTIEVYPGRVRIGKDAIIFGYIRVLTTEGKLQMMASSLSMDTDKSSINVAQVETQGDDIIIRDAAIAMNEDYVRSMQEEGDVIRADVEEIRLKSPVRDSMASSGIWRLKGVEINGFNLEMSRDKRLPDPEPVRKPHLLSAFIPIPETVDPGVISATSGKLVYRETGEKTGRTGMIRLEDIEFIYAPKARRGQPVLEGAFNVYGDGLASFAYREQDDNHFDFQVRLTDMSLPLFNQMIDSLEAIKVKSGKLREFDLFITGDSLAATGEGLINYEDLHIEIFKRGEPEVSNLGSELITLLADGIILRHSREDAIAGISQERIPYKSPINYWIKSVVQGVMKTVRKGRKPR